MTMKKILFAIILAAGFSAQAGLVSSNLLTLATVNLATNAGSGVNMGNTYLPQTTFMVQSVGTGGTNTVCGGYLYVGFSTNTTNAQLIATIATTNDSILAYNLASNTMPVYFFFSAFNRTNTAVSIGAQAVQNR
jgi:hypothetical protein